MVFISFLILAQKHTLWVLRIRISYSEQPQFMFLIQIKENNENHCEPDFGYICVVEAAPTTFVWNNNEENVISNHLVIPISRAVKHFILLCRQVNVISVTILT